MLNVESKKDRTHNRASRKINYDTIVAYIYSFIIGHAVGGIIFVCVNMTNF